LKVERNCDSMLDGFWHLTKPLVNLQLTVKSYFANFNKSTMIMTTCNLTNRQESW
jgi:hypothetical protein